MFNFFVYNDKLEKIGFINNFESIQWLEDYQSAGEIKIVAKATDENRALIKEGYRIQNNDSTSIAIINHVEINYDGQSNTLTARGETTLELLNDRIVMGTERVTNIEQGMYNIYKNNRRGLPIEIAPLKGYAESTDSETTWDDVLDAEKKFAEFADFGLRVNFDPVTMKETFEVYKGIDRTNINSSNYVGWLGTDIDNIYDFDIVNSDKEYKNVAIVVAEKEDKSLKIVTVNLLPNLVGEKRKEMYVDAKDLKPTYQVSVDTGQLDENGMPVYENEDRTYTNAEYENILKAKGFEKLLEQEKNNTVSANVSQSNILFGKDYFLGDRLPIKLHELEIMTSARVKNVNRIYEGAENEIRIGLDKFEEATI